MESCCLYKSINHSPSTWDEDGNYDDDDDDDDDVTALQGQTEYYANELSLNAKLRVFAVNCSLLYGGHNTVHAQLHVKSKRGQYYIIIIIMIIIIREIEIM